MTNTERLEMYLRKQSLITSRKSPLYKTVSANHTTYLIPVESLVCFKTTGKVEAAIHYHSVLSNVFAEKLFI